MPPDPRRQARALALVCLYQRQKLGPNPTAEAWFLDESTLPAKALAFARFLIDTTTLQETQIDQLIQAHLQGWKQSRLLTPLNVLLKLAVAELISVPKTDAKVVFNEAIELCRLYVSEDSVKLLNGVLHAITQEIRPR